MSTDPTGKFDLPDHPDTRLYLLSEQAAWRPGRSNIEALPAFLNPLPSEQVQRALWEDLDQWSTQGVTPPPPRVPLLSDGNDIAGIRLPELTVPLATYTGWGVWANDGCEASGQYIAFQATKAQRIAAGDPRPSVQERYPSFAMYRAAVMNALDNLVKDRFMLCEDTQAVFARLLNAGLATGVSAPNGNPMPQEQVPSCKSNDKSG